MDALARSPADQTEVLALDRASWSLSRSDAGERVERAESLLVRARVIEGRRTGSHRGGGVGAADLDVAIRRALAQATVRTEVRPPPFLAADEPTPLDLVTSDDETVALDDQVVSAAIEPLRAGEEVAVERHVGRLVIATSSGLLQSALLTAVSAAASSGGGAGAGMANASSRSWRHLDVGQLLDLARGRRGDAGATAEPGPRDALVLGASAVCRLLELVNLESLSSRSFRDGTSFLREHRGVHVFGSGLEVDDDCTEPAVLALPFDLEGAARRRVALIGNGVARTPALDRRSATEFGLEPTGGCWGDDEGLALNVVLRPGDLDSAALLGIADGGVFAGGISAVECLEPGRLLIRARLVNTRRIEAGRIGSPVGDLIWEDSLLRALGSLLGVGARLESTPGPDPLLSSTTAPWLAIAQPQRLSRP